MLFLQPLYNILTNSPASRINHFALLKLIFYSLDKTILYFLIFAFLRLCWLIFVRHRRSLFSETCVWIFAFYLILLMMLTTFRDTYFPWQWSLNLHRSFSDINLVFLKETWKLTRGASLLDFFYNSLGNIIWFIPFGALLPIVLQKKKCFALTTLLGFLLSVTIESFQFVLMTGVSDIDDVFFNVCGAILGYGIYVLVKNFHHRISN
ncbi:VanZ family protein [Lactobacillus rodentium]|uniref:Glycopeptide antibiotics resistance protein n=1 Tax=Lactobacillus rodentium TaxID=947835 RepID=A0A2Z6TSB6_9LACO|nr:VanZ family protein [Lactobacillus rodentium]MCR1894303.1 VanZ family protein [Lactobacillus rodentium]GBG04599.1 glycopeptide antibiotics resistance protein [Lactobacillus rodentium]